MTEGTGATPSAAVRKTCFVISAFGATPEESNRTKQVLRHLVRKVLVPLGYDVVRADDIDDEGLITNQIIEHLLDDDLVVADLSGRNPNVFYELAVRHAARKPIVHLITAGEAIPFDVGNMRTIQYALDDPDILEDAQAELGRKVGAIEANDGSSSNPISAARDIWLLRESDNPETRDAGEVLAAVSEIRDELRAFARRTTAADGSPRSRSGPRYVSDELSSPRVQNAIVNLLRAHGPVTAEDIAELLGYSYSTVVHPLKELWERGTVVYDGPKARLADPDGSGNA
jgi:hypothetical protein